jgi:hypothetical protein
VTAVLRPGGLFVLGDVVVPEEPTDAVTPIEPDYHITSRVDEQLRWLTATGLPAHFVWAERDVAVLVAERAGGSNRR